MPRKGPRKTVGKYDKRSAKFGFHEWNLDSFEEAMKMVLQEALAIATEEYEISAWFAYEYGMDSDGTGTGREKIKMPEDFSTVYVELPLGHTEFENPRWSFTLTDLVASMIDICEHGEGGHIDEDDKPSLRVVRDQLRTLADTLDAAMARPVPEDDA
jgi:hypothetical protein